MTQEALFQELQKILNESGGPDGAMTSSDIADKMNVSQATAVQYLRKIKRAGKLRHCKVRRETLNGIMALTDAYYLE